jgi:hypothetical protein
VFLAFTWPEPEAQSLKEQLAVPATRRAA